jgi:hypothetical protein
MVLGGKEHAEMTMLKLNLRRIVPLIGVVVLAVVVLGVLLNQPEPEMSVDKADFNKALVATFQEVYERAGVDDFKMSLGEDGSLRVRYPPGGLTDAQEKVIANYDFTEIFERHLARGME